jgi:hypothetical protein
MRLVNNYLPVTAFAASLKRLLICNERFISWSDAIFDIILAVAWDMQVIALAMKLPQCLQ